MTNEAIFPSQKTRSKSGLRSRSWAFCLEPELSLKFRTGALRGGSGSGSLHRYYNGFAKLTEK